MGQRDDEVDHAGKNGARDPPPPQFLEVTCRSSGKVRRFAAGTTARYALHAVNRKLAAGAPVALHVEAAKDGEEPISFGPSALLADYGQGWKLQTLTEEDAPGFHPAQPETKRGEVRQHEQEGRPLKSTYVYVGKIGLAFVFLFLLGGLLTYLLETLPDMMQPASTTESL